MLKGGCLEASPFYYQAYDKKIQWTFLVAMHPEEAAGGRFCR